MYVKDYIYMHVCLSVDLLVSNKASTGIVSESSPIGLIYKWIGMQNIVEII